MKFLLHPVVLAICIASGGIATLASPAFASDSDDSHPVTTVPLLDLERYVGVWYEIARIPNRFQKKCARGTTATYTLREDGRITVVNRCTKEDGGVIEARGVAKIVDTSTNAKLKVSFFSLLGWRPVWGDYWVIGLDEDYQWAIVGTPDRKYGWVLARSPVLDEDALDGIYKIIERNGYQRDQFVESEH